MERNRLVRGISAALFCLGMIIIYVAYYQSPAIRFANRIMPLVYKTETESVYQEGEYQIYVTEQDSETEVKFISGNGIHATFFVMQDGYEVSAFDASHNKLLSGTWGGKKLRGSDGKALPVYDKMCTRLRSEHFYPEAAAAIYICKTYRTATHGGKRAPLLIFGAVIIWMTALIKLDNGAVWDRNLRYTLPMLADYGKEQKSEQTKEAERFIAVSAGILGVVCIGILLYDVFCY